MKAPAPQGNQWCRGQPQGQFAIRQHRAELTMPSANPLYPPGRSRPTSAGNAWINSNFKRLGAEPNANRATETKIVPESAVCSSASRAAAAPPSSAARGTGSGGGGCARFQQYCPMGVRTRGPDIAIGKTPYRELRHRSNQVTARRRERQWRAPDRLDRGRLSLARSGSIPSPAAVRPR
jgi:hypothetical protein